MGIDMILFEKWITPYLLGRDVGMFRTELAGRVKVALEAELAHRRALLEEAQAQLEMRLADRDEYRRQLKEESEALLARERRLLAAEFDAMKEEQRQYADVGRAVETLLWFAEAVIRDADD